MATLALLLLTKPTTASPVDSAALSAKWAAEDNARWALRRNVSLAHALRSPRPPTQPGVGVWNTCPCIAPSFCHFPANGSPCPHTGTCQGTGVVCSCTDCYRKPTGENNTVCQDCPAPTPPPTQPIPPSPTPGSFELWADPPGSELYEKYSPAWYDHIYVRATLPLDFIADESAHFTANSTTSTYRGGPNGVGDDGNVFVDVAMGEHGAIHLYADPQFLQIYDNRIRALSNASAAMNYTGVMDRCGWPLPDGKGAAGTQGAGEECTALPCTGKEFKRTTTGLFDDFSNGLDSKKWTVALKKGCCERTPGSANIFERNIFTEWDSEEEGGEQFPVLALRSHAIDDTLTCPGPECHKIVKHGGSIATSDLYASGRYDVVAKVPASSGLIWAVWTYHYEEHFPTDCAKDQCWCSQMPANQSVWTEAQCEPGRWSDTPGGPQKLHGCKTPNLCGPASDGWTSTPTPAPTGQFPIYSPSQCGLHHSPQHGVPGTSWIGDDPQFLGEASFAGYLTKVNHEIDIEIPANCQGTVNVCDAKLNVSWGKQGVCTNLYNTANFNNYIYTNTGGTGPAYSNMCIRAWKGKTRGGTPLNLIGDGKYHNYSFDWHTGDASAEIPGRVDFYFDGVYLGTNNAHVPTRASRLWIAHWYNSGAKNPNVSVPGFCCCYSLLVACTVYSYVRTV